MPDSPPLPLNVLYAEDDPNDAFFMRRAFDKLGDAAVLNIVPHGLEAIRYLSGEGEYADRARYAQPRLLFLDVKMPERSGLEVLEWVRKRSEFAALPILMFTSSTQESDVEASRRLGANAYLVKPSNSTHLSLLMKDVLAAATTPLPADGRIPLKGNLLMVQNAPDGPKF